MSHQGTFVVVRFSSDEFTFALVQARVATEDLLSEACFREALEKALTNWARETKEGREAWESSSEDFNVGDLACALPSESLAPYLAKEGILWLEVATTVHHAPCTHWCYDTILLDESKLSKETER